VESNDLGCTFPCSIRAIALLEEIQNNPVLVAPASDLLGADADVRVTKIMVGLTITPTASRFPCLGASQSLGSVSIHG
jgi:hypothetical protein